jgi:hypothetical protein
MPSRTATFELGLFKKCRISKNSYLFLMEDKGLAFEEEGGPGRVGPVLGRSLLVEAVRVV